jgi:hypothetical protein
MKTPKKNAYIAAGVCATEVESAQTADPTTDCPVLSTPLLSDRFRAKMERLPNVFRSTEQPIEDHSEYA